MKKKIKTAVIGIGGMGLNHCRILNDISEVVGVCDLDKSKLENAKSSLGVRTFLNLSELLKVTRPDGVVVAVNTEHHLQVGSDVIKRGFPLLIEKPLAGNFKDALKLCTIAKRKNIFLMVGMVERYNPVIMKLHQDINTGVFGDVYQIVSLRVGIEPPKMKDRNVLLDLAVHDIDILSFLLKANPLGVSHVGNAYVKGSNIDASQMILSFKKTSAVIITNWLSPIKIRKMYVFGSKKSAELDLREQFVTYFSKIPKKAIDKSDYFNSFSSLEAFASPQSVKKNEPLRSELIEFTKNVTNGYNGKFCEGAASAIRIIEQSKKI
ncbi:MAG: Gfo/Idh/MocA family oxidoreductase [Candidatus Levybacteria bacterium]|nr:Gfo/Idh/MocA family oxidoreductase [Candidatus Levybacteria bacterium]